MHSVVFVFAPMTKNDHAIQLRREVQSAHNENIAMHDVWPEDFMLTDSKIVSLIEFADAPVAPPPYDNRTKIPVDVLRDNVVRAHVVSRRYGPRQSYELVLRAMLMDERYAALYRRGHYRMFFSALASLYDGFQLWAVQGDEIIKLELNHDG